MKRVIAVAAACAAVLSTGAAPASAEERWEFLLGGAVVGSEIVEESGAGFSGAGSFTFQGTKIETSYRIEHDATGAPATYALTLTVPGAKVVVASSVAAGQLTLTVSQNGAVAGTKAFPLSPSLVILDNNVFGQYRQLARLLSPEGPARVSVQMLVPQALALIPLEAVRQPGTWRWSSSGASGTARSVGAFLAGPAAREGLAGPRLGTDRPGGAPSGTDPRAPRRARRSPPRPPPRRPGPRTSPPRSKRRTSRSSRGGSASGRPSPGRRVRPVGSPAW